MASPRTIPCPHCGAPVRARALVCAECGSDAETGWAEDADVWRADIPDGYGDFDDDDDLDMDAFYSREGLEDPLRPSHHTWKRRLGFALVIALIIWLVWFR